MACKLQKKMGFLQVVHRYMYIYVMCAWIRLNRCTHMKFCLLCRNAPTLSLLASHNPENQRILRCVLPPPLSIAIGPGSLVLLCVQVSPGLNHHHNLLKWFVKHPKILTLTLSIYPGTDSPCSSLEHVKLPCC